jgi:hypothetical protein
MTRTRKIYVIRTLPGLFSLYDAVYPRQKRWANLGLLSLTRIFALITLKRRTNTIHVKLYIHVTCIVIDFFLNNQPDALIIEILFCYKTLHVSGSSSAHHQEFSTVHSALASFMQSQDGTTVPSWLCLEAVIRNLHETYQCRMYSRKLLMMGKEDARNM